MNRVWSVLAVWVACAGMLCGCSPGASINQRSVKKGSAPSWAAQSYPAGYEQWQPFTAKPISRSELNETRRLYLNGVAKKAVDGRYPVGSVLVKAQYRMNSDGNGTPYQLAVMRKEGGKQQHGWTFAVYDPKRFMQVPFDQDLCLLCHSQRADRDFVFSRFPTK